jgi:hypothetical protein
MPRSIRSCLLLAAALALGPTTFAAAKPAAGRTAATKLRVRAIGPNVVTKRGVPAISLAKAAPAEPLSGQMPAIDLDNAPWLVPVVAPFEGKIELTAHKPYVDPAGVVTTHGDVRTIATPGIPAGFAFDGVGWMNLALPASAIGSSDLLISCEGALPATVQIYAQRIAKSSTLAWHLMDLTNVTTKAKFVVVTGDLPDEELFMVSIGYQQGAPWRVDRCTLERV